MNFYTSDVYLRIAAESFFPGHDARPRDYSVAGEVYRLLEVDGQPVTRLAFLDYHAPLTPEERPNPSATLPYLANAVVEVREVDHAPPQAADEAIRWAPTISWADFATWDDYYDFLRKRSRHIRNDVRAGRRLAEQFDSFAFEYDDPADDVLPFCFVLKGRQSKETLGMDLFEDPRRRNYFHRLKEAGLLRASTLRGDGRLIAATLAVDWGNRWFGWVTTYDPDPAFRKWSPGRQLLINQMRHSLEAGHSEFDLGEGDMDYKWYFATHTRAVGPVGRPPLAHAVSSAMRDVIKASPWLHRQVRAVRDLVASR